MAENQIQFEKENLKKDLKDRHIQLIAIGGVIGVALFMGSAQSIHQAGPALILSYGFGGLVMFFVMRALGEMAIEFPVSASFSGYAKTFIGPKASFITGWTYWYMWVTIAMCEITAVGMYMQYWWPNITQWVVAIITLVVMTVINLIAVKLYGEFEFWFALIKVITIVFMLIVGGAMMLFGFGNAGVAVGISNLWSHGGFMPHGITGVMAALVMVTFAYSGVEMIGVTAGEAKDAEKSISSAVNKVFWRVLIFYVGSVIVILSIYPWDQMRSDVSPFVLIFEKIGIPYSASVMNFVIMTSAASCLNSGLYTCGRMLYGLALRHEAPAFLGKLSGSQVPQNAILASAFIALIGVWMNYVSPDKVFYYISAASVTGCVWAWAVIVIEHLQWRKRLSLEQISKLKFAMPLCPYGNYFVLLFLVGVCYGMTADPDNLNGLYAGAVWYPALIICYFLFGVAKRQKKAEEAGIKTEW